MEWSHGTIPPVIGYRLAGGSRTRVAGGGPESR